MTQPLPINPDILIWARNEAGLSLAYVAEKAKIRQLKNPPTTAEERLNDWEKGNKQPTFNQLKSIAKVYRRPEITFFLDNPPVKSSLLTDFRFVDGFKAKDSPEFSNLKRRVEILQNELQALAKQEYSQPLSFVKSLSIDDYSSSPKNCILKIVSKIRELLAINFTEQREQKTKNDFFTYLREKIENIGVYVILMGDLGSHHSSIPPDEFRGIAIANPFAPLIVINPNDAKTATIFTLIHEFTHIILGNNAISNLNVFYGNKNYKKEEIICNAVAAEFLVPEQEIENLLHVKKWAHLTNQEFTINIVDEIAKSFNVSNAVVGRRLLEHKYIKKEHYNSLLDINKKRWADAKKKQKKSKGGPSRNVVDKYRLGKKTLNTIIGAAYNGRISLQDASRIIHIPVYRFDKVLP